MNKNYDGADIEIEGGVLGKQTKIGRKGQVIVVAMCGTKIT